MSKQNLKIIVRGAYQVQKLRIQTGNRIAGNFKSKLGQLPGVSEEEGLEKEAQKVLDLLRADYKKITDGIARFPNAKKFVGHGLIDSYTELCLLEQYFELEKAEENHFKRIKGMLADYPLWTEFLLDIKGIGPALGGIIITEIDIAKAEYPSSLWKYAGLDVAWDGKGRNKTKPHLEKREYITKAKKKDFRNSITFNPTLKTKLMGVAAASFLRCGTSSPYAAAYYDYKQRIESHPEHMDLYIAIDVKGCADILGKGKDARKIIKRSDVTKAFENCKKHVNVPDAMAEAAESSPQAGLELEAYITKQAKESMKQYLGKYEILEDLKAKGLIVGPYHDEDELLKEVKALGGLLRKPKEVVQFVEEEDDGDEIDVQGQLVTVEEFDDTPDAKGRTLYRLKNVGKTKAHRHQMSLRFMIKRFLVDLYYAWRVLEGLPVSAEYSDAKLGLTHKVAKSLTFNSSASDLIKTTVFKLKTFTFEGLCAEINKGKTKVEEKVIHAYLFDLQRLQFLTEEDGNYKVTI